MQSASTNPNPATTAASARGNQPRQCWECLRRRWVCDAARPVCNKCRAAGIVCPGYSDQKPLTWLAPGRVTSRTRRQQPRTDNRRKRPDSPPAKHAATRKSKVANDVSDRSESHGRKEGQGAEVTMRGADGSHADLSGALISARSPLIIANGSGSGSGSRAGGAASELATVNIETLFIVTRCSKLRTDVCDIAEAVQYCTSFLHPLFLRCAQPALYPGSFRCPASKAQFVSHNNATQTLPKTMFDSQTDPLTYLVNR